MRSRVLSLEVVDQLRYSAGSLREIERQLVRMDRVGIGRHEEVVGGAALRDPGESVPPRHPSIARARPAENSSSPRCWRMTSFAVVIDEQPAVLAAHHLPVEANLRQQATVIRAGHAGLFGCARVVLDAAGSPRAAGAHTSGSFRRTPGSAIPSGGRADRHLEAHRCRDVALPISRGGRPLPSSSSGSLATATTTSPASGGGSEMGAWRSLTGCTAPIPARSNVDPLELAGLCDVEEGVGSEAVDSHMWD